MITPARFELVPGSTIYRFGGGLGQAFPMLPRTLHDVFRAIRYTAELCAYERAAQFEA